VKNITDFLFLSENRLNPFVWIKPEQIEIYLLGSNSVFQTGIKNRIEITIAPKSAIGVAHTMPFTHGYCPEYILPAKIISIFVSSESRQNNGA